jgi:type I restriction enzyme S subunit
MGKIKSVKLKDIIISSRSGVSRKLSTEDIGYYVVRSGNIQNGNFIKDPQKFWHTIDDQGTDLTKYILEEGDILVNFINSLAQIGKTAIFKDIGRECIFTTNIFQLKLKENLLDKYFLYYSMSEDYYKFISSITKPAVNQASFTRKNFGELPIPLPPLPEQQRIVAKLDGLFAKIDQAIGLLEENITHTQDLMGSVLDGIFDKVYKEHKSVPLLKHVNFIGGSQPPKSNFSYELKEGYVRLIQIRDYKSDRHLVYIKEDSTKKFCDEQDVMIGRYGPPVFQILRGLKGAYNVALMKAIPEEEVILKDYLYYFLMNGRIQNYIISISQRAAGQSGVNKKALEAYEIAIPSLKEQQKIVDTIKAAIPKIDRAQKLTNQNLENLKALKSSLLDQAFKGEL